MKKMLWKKAYPVTAHFAFSWELFSLSTEATRKHWKSESSSFALTAQVVLTANQKKKAK